MKEIVIKKCMKCGAMVSIIKDCTCDGCGVRCCEEEMVVLTPNSDDTAAVEKHVPNVERVEDEIYVTVNHVMEKDHYIKFIAMVTDTMESRVTLYPEGPAEARFKYVPGATIYAYCNKHGLWSTEVK